MKQFLSLILLTCCMNLQAVQSIRLVIYSGDFPRENTLVCADVTQTILKKANYAGLYELVEGKKIPVPCQLEISNGSSNLYWVLSGKTEPRKQRTFIVESSQSEKNESPVQLIDKSGEICILSGKSPLLQYNYKTIYPPAGVDSVFRRSGFIHPVWSPAGDTLTNIQPKDHYHHYGIWNPWTRVEYDGTIYDLWNLGDRKGTVKFEKILAKSEGAVFAGFSVSHGHFIFSNQSEKKIMDEALSIKVWKNQNTDQPSFYWDFQSILHPNTDLPVILKEYRYAGFSYRATDVWTKDNCIMVTSEGNERPKIDGERARWIYIMGDCSKGRAGMLFMGHPKNYNYPEPLRIWDAKANGGRGDAFINFAPTKNMDWTLSPEKKYTLGYRVVVFDGEMNPEKAEQLWRDFAYPVEIKITENLK